MNIHSIINPLAHRLAKPLAVPLNLLPNAWITPRQLIALFIAATVSMHAVSQYQSASTAYQAARVASLPARATARPEMPSIDAAQLTAASRITDRLSIPWQPLFIALKDSRSPGIALTQLLPEASERRLRIEGTAKDYLALMNYIALLEHQPAFAQVRLLQHRPQAQAANPADAASLGFTIAIDWAIAERRQP